MNWIVGVILIGQKFILKCGSWLKTCNYFLLFMADHEADKDPKMDFDDQGSTDVVKKMARSAMKKRQ